MRNLGNTLTRHFYSANFGRIGTTTDDRKVAILINVMDEQGNALTDHVWIKNSECDFSLDGITFKKGDRVFFSAEPYRYIKGIWRHQAVKQLKVDIGLRNVIFNQVRTEKNASRCPRGLAHE